MPLNFQRGSGKEPKGHALLYFREARMPDKLLATYIVVLPIAMQVTKYMPPFLASQAAALEAKDFSAFALPPVPEEVESLKQIEALAQTRDDDLLFGGEVDTTQLSQALLAVNEIVQTYAQTYQEYLETLSSKPTVADVTSGVGVKEVLYQLMAERDRLTELAKLIGKLHFALGGGDEPLVREVEEELAVVQRYIPPKYRVARVLQAARAPTRTRPGLAELYLEWCYKLADEDYPALQRLEERIQRLEGEGHP